MAELREYLWIAICGGIFGFMYGFLIGANDVANAFASSVSSKSLTLKQAVVAATFCEFFGAFFLGASVTSTIRSKVVDVDLYEDQPDVLMFGMFTALTAAVIMLWGATYLGLPVSTTHDIVGCIMGFSIVAKGIDSIEWDVVKNIFMSWFISPLVAGFLSFIFFSTLKYFVLKAEQPFQRAYYTFPVVLTIGVGIDLFYVLIKGTSNTDMEDKIKEGWVACIAFSAGFFCGLIWIFVVGPMVMKRMENDKAAKEMGIKDGPEEAVEQADDDVTAEVDITGYSTVKASVQVFDNGDGTTAAPEAPLVDVEEVRNEGTEEPVSKAADVAKEGTQAPVAKSGFQRALQKFGESTYNQDLHAQSMAENKGAAQIWENGEDYDEDTEHLFNFVQVFTACLNSFAHGANDVSNTIAPLSAILYIYQNGEIQSKNEVQKWILAYGGCAIVVGLLLYGYKVMKSLGYKLTKLSPSRGASASLAASLTVVTASFMGIPVSSTQCIVGATAGVGLVNGWRNVQWWFLLKVCCGWVVMFFMAITLSAGIFAFATFSPDL